MKNSFSKLSGKIQSISSNASDAMTTAAKGVAASTTEAGRKFAEMGAGAAEATGKKIGQAATFLSDTAEGTAKEASAIATNTYASVAASASKAGTTATEVASAAGAAFSAGAETLSRSVATVATTAFDQNGDGSFDQEDLRILTQKGLAAANVAATEIGVLAKEVASSELVKDTASAAAVGAVVAIPVPLIGPAAGAAIGAAIGVYSSLRKK